MKRQCILSGLLIGLCFLFPSYAYGSVIINLDKTPQGLARIQYTGDLSKAVKVLVEANGDKNTYSIRNNAPSYVPLQMGEGTYKISVLQQVEGTKYKPLKSESVEVKNVDVNQMFTSSSLLVNFDSSMKAIQGFNALSNNKNINKRIQNIYNEIVTKYSYDFDKIRNVTSDYVPLIDEFYTSKKGICFDYSVMFAGVLRSTGIPTKLIMGYAPEINEYHAWNEVLVNGKWVAVDTTYDSQYYKAKQNYTFEKDKSKRKVVKVY